MWTELSTSHSSRLCRGRFIPRVTPIERHKHSRQCSNRILHRKRVSQTHAMEVLQYLPVGTVGLAGNFLIFSFPSTASGTGAKTAWEMLCEELYLTHITTSCKDLDAILGGGITCKEITEIGGVPGIGKTQLGMQLAINVQIPVDCGGLGGKAVYIDTEGSFRVERACQIAEACIQDMLDGLQCQQRDFQVCQDKIQPKVFLENIFYYRICSYAEQIAVINNLDTFIAEHKDIKVVIIDSISFHFRQDFDDLALRTRVLGELALKLLKLAKICSIAVVVLNQVTNKMVGGSYQLSLALGDSWSHACTNRIILYWSGNERYAYIDKSPSLPSASAPFSVTGKGIRNAASNCKRIKTM